MQRTAAGIVGEKGSVVFSVMSTDTVYRALEVMAEKNVGSVLVIDDETLVGILSERDYSRKIILLDRGSRETAVAEIMTSKLITVGPETTVTDAMELMTEKRVRHLPVLEDGDLDRRRGQGGDRRSAGPHRPARALHNWVGPDREHIALTVVAGR